MRQLLTRVKPDSATVGLEGKQVAVQFADAGARSGIGNGSSQLSERLLVSGRLIRVATPRSEAFDPLEDPEPLLSQLRQNGFAADLFSFAQRLSEPEPR